MQKPQKRFQEEKNRAEQDRQSYRDTHHKAGNHEKFQYMLQGGGGGQQGITYLLNLLLLLPGSLPTLFALEGCAGLSSRLWRILCFFRVRGSNRSFTSAV